MSITNHVLISAKESRLVPAKVSGYGTWRVWLCVVVVALIPLLTVLDIAPFLHIDEFMTVDLGRTILQPDSGWSIAWMHERSQPAFVFFYLGPVLQELTFQGMGEYGPRLSGILGAAMAASAMVGWLLARGAYRIAALLLGLTFLLDPVFVQAYTIGRVDGWAMAACLTACWVLRSIGGEEETGSVKKKLLIAGSLTALGFFIWPSPVFLVPLLLIELGAAVKRVKVSQSMREYHLPFFGLFCVGGLVATILLLIPIAPKLIELADNVVDGIIINSRTGTSNHSLLDSNRIMSGSIHLLQVLKFTPVLVLLALVGLIKGRELGLVAAGMAATLLMVCTVVYSHRIQYLLPYFIVAAATRFTTESKLGFKQRVGFLNVFGLVLLVSWAAGLSLVARTAIALENKSELKRSQVYQAAQDMIGPGEKAVYSLPYEFYYVGRHLGWKMYKPYLAVGVNPLINHDVLHQTLSLVDYAIMPLDQMTPELENQFQTSGLYSKGTYHVYESTLNASDKVVTNKTRLQTFYFMPQQPYGPYQLFIKEKRLSLDASTVY
ncbi:hypothetical protein [Pontibacter roseus]|uniref:hypothetical protein n=1 Tax=Pontibacter roseus TaxID=336989 RepID=UPI000380ECD5|nr:hypothetical protein [Pontibacter roseus]